MYMEPSRPAHKHFTGSPLKPLNVSRVGVGIKCSLFFIYLISAHKKLYLYWLKKYIKQISAPLPNDKHSFMGLIILFWALACLLNIPFLCPCYSVLTHMHIFDYFYMLSPNLWMMTSLMCDKQNIKISREKTCALDGPKIFFLYVIPK